MQFWQTKCPWFGASRGVLFGRMQALRSLIRTFPSVLLGYSGGVDSALLAVVLRQGLRKGGGPRRDRPQRLVPGHPVADGTGRGDAIRYPPDRDSHARARRPQLSRSG